MCRSGFAARCRSGLMSCLPSPGTWAFRFRSCWGEGTVNEKNPHPVELDGSSATLVAGGGFEPPSSGLGARRGTELLHPAVCAPHYTRDHVDAKPRPGDLGPM